MSHAHVSAVSVQSEHAAQAAADRPPLQVKVGRNLRAYRRERGMQQQVLARQLGVHRTYIGSLERGTCNLTLRSLERIATTLGLDPLDLLADIALSREAGDCAHGGV